MAAEGNSYNSKYYDLDRNIQETSIFGDLVNTTFKDILILVPLLYGIATVSSDFLVDTTLSNYVNKNNITIYDKENAANKIIKNYDDALNNNGVFNLANKISTKLTIFSSDKREYADIALEDLIKDVVKFDNLKDLTNKMELMEKEKDTFMTKYQITPGSKSALVLEEKLMIEKESIQREIDIVNNYNKKISEIKEKNKTQELTRG